MNRPDHSDDTCEEPDCDRVAYARGWCGMHYKRWLRTGSPLRGEQPTVCSVDGCQRDVVTRGWCHGHYQRWWRSGELLPEVPLGRRRQPARCSVDGCDRGSHAKSLCRTHYRRWCQAGTERPEDPIRVVTGTGHEHHGYWVVPVPADERWLVGGETKVGEHRLVMARNLGRPLFEDEVVHHRNGVRTDNRLENLELWSTAHPRGQRITDKVAFAVDMLRRYAPERLSAGPDDPQHERPLSG